MKRAQSSRSQTSGPLLTRWLVVVVIGVAVAVPVSTFATHTSSPQVVGSSEEVEQALRKVIDNATASSKAARAHGFPTVRYDNLHLANDDASYQPAVARIFAILRELQHETSNLITGARYVSVPPFVASRGVASNVPRIYICSNHAPFLLPLTFRSQDRGTAVFAIIVSTGAFQHFASNPLLKAVLGQAYASHIFRMNEELLNDDDRLLPKTAAFTDEFKRIKWVVGDDTAYDYRHQAYRQFLAYCNFEAKNGRRNAPLDPMREPCALKAFDLWAAQEQGERPYIELKQLRYKQQVQIDKLNLWLTRDIGAMQVVFLTQMRIPLVGAARTPEDPPDYFWMGWSSSPLPSYRVAIAEMQASLKDTTRPRTAMQFNGKRL